MSRISVWKPLARKSGGLDQMITGSIPYSEKTAVIDTDGEDTLIVAGGDNSKYQGKAIYSIVDGVVTKLNNSSVPDFTVNVRGNTIELTKNDSSLSYYWVFPF